MTAALFRTEVMQARRQRSLGRLVVVPAWPLWLGAAVVAAAALGLVLLLALGEYTRRTRVSGQLLPVQGQSRVDAPFAGSVARLSVREGQRVLAGQVVAEVVAVREGERGDVADVSRSSRLQRRQLLADAARAQLRELDQRSRGLSRQIDDIAGEQALMASQLQVQLRQEALATGTLQRMRQLHAKRYVSDLQLVQQETSLLEQQAAVFSARRQLVALARTASQLRQARDEIPSQRAAIAAQSRREAALLAAESAEAEARSRARLRAPVAGVVGHVEVAPGQSVVAGQALVGLLPAVSELEAHLAVPSSAVGLLAPGDVVQLRFHAYPYASHGHQAGRIVRVTGSALPMGEGATQPLFRAVVVLDRQHIDTRGGLRRLRSGMTLDADVMGERRRLWQWALQPLRRLGDGFGGGKSESPMPVDADFAPPDEGFAGIQVSPPVIR